MKRDSNELIYVIAGKEDSLVGAQSSELLDKLLAPSQRVTGLLDAEGDSVIASEVFDELRTAPFLTDKRIVLIRRADDFITQNRPLLEKYFDHPCPTGRLILTVGSWDSRTKLAKKLPEVGKLISITEPKRWELPQRLTAYASDAYNKRLSRDAAELLVELTGDDLTRLYSEIDKLALFADAEKVITAKHIESLVGHNRLFNAFSVIDAMIAGNAGAAVERLRGMFADDKSAEYTVVGAFAFHFRRLFNAKALLEKGVGRVEIEKKLHIWGNKDGFFAQLRRMSLRQIGAYLQHLAETDYAIKTGRTKAPIAMEQFVLQLALK
ncbi:MAG: DNA polymerase III subunit delta [Planctomycetes bacterium RBG_16_55_9]|nr:MAG: DNA polymerase III subunit delta [Planctomycetes bacterium RBG_16_55_9]